MSTRVVLRADGGGTIGIGHVMRCTTLGAALVERGADVVLVSSELPGALAERAGRSGLTTVDAGGDRWSVEPITALAPDLVVVDGYELGPLVTALRVAGVPFGLVDDNRELPIDGAAVVLNHNLFATPAMYPEATVDQRLLLGSSWCLVRPDVVDVRRADGARRIGAEVLVALGGADPLGMTLAIAEALVTSGCETWIGIGATNPQRARIEDLAARRPDLVRVDPGDLIAAYGRVDVAVVGAGTTIYELAYLGVPGIGLVVADNQEQGAHRAAWAGFLEVVDVRSGQVDADGIAERCRHLLADAGRRAAMAAAGRRSVDGGGAGRVADAILALVS